MVSTDIPITTPEASEASPSTPFPSPSPSTTTPRVVSLVDLKTKAERALFVLEAINLCKLVPGCDFDVLYDQVKNAPTNFPEITTHFLFFNAPNYTEIDQTELKRIIGNLIEVNCVEGFYGILWKRENNSKSFTQWKLTRKGEDMLSKTEEFEKLYVSTRSAHSLNGVPLSHEELKIVLERLAMEYLGMEENRSHVRDLSKLLPGVNQVLRNGPQRLYPVVSLSESDLKSIFLSLESPNLRYVNSVTTSDPMGEPRERFHITWEGVLALTKSDYFDKVFKKIPLQSTAASAAGEAEESTPIQQVKTDHGDEEKDAEVPATSLEINIVACLSSPFLQISPLPPLVAPCFGAREYGRYFLTLMRDKEEAEKRGLPVLDAFSEDDIEKALNDLKRTNIIEPLGEERTPLVNTHWQLTEELKISNLLFDITRKLSEGNCSASDPPSPIPKSTGPQPERDIDDVLEELLSKALGEMDTLKKKALQTQKVTSTVRVQVSTFNMTPKEEKKEDEPKEQEEFRKLLQGAILWNLLQRKNNQDNQERVTNRITVDRREFEDLQEIILILLSGEPPRSIFYVSSLLNPGRQTVIPNVVLRAAFFDLKDREMLKMNLPESEIMASTWEVTAKGERGAGLSQFRTRGQALQRAATLKLNDISNSEENPQQEDTTSKYLSPAERKILEIVGTAKCDDGHVLSIPTSLNIRDAFNQHSVHGEANVTWDRVRVILHRLLTLGLVKKTSRAGVDQPCLWKITEKGKHLLIEKSKGKKEEEHSVSGDPRREDLMEQKILEILDLHRSDDGTWCDATDAVILTDMLNNHSNPPVKTNLEEVLHCLNTLTAKCHVEKDSFFLPSGQSKSVWKITATGRDLRRKSLWNKIDEYQKRDKLLEVAIQELLYWESAEDGFEPECYTKNAIVDALLLHTLSLNSLSFHHEDVEMVLNSLMERGTLKLELGKHYKLDAAVYKNKAAEVHGRMPSGFNEEYVVAILQSLEIDQSITPHTLLKIARDILAKKWGRTLHRDDHILLKRHFYYVLRSGFITEDSKFFNDYQITESGKSHLADIISKATQEVTVEPEEDKETMIPPKYYKYVPALLRIFTAKTVLECGKDKFCRLLEQMKRHMPYEREEHLRAALSWFVEHGWMAVVNNQYGECWWLKADHTVKFQKLTTCLERRAKRQKTLPETYHGCVPALLELFKDGSIEEPKDDKDHCYITSLLKDTCLLCSRLSNSLKSEFIHYLFLHGWLVDCRKAGSLANCCTIAKGKEAELQRIASIARWNIEYNKTEGDEDIPPLFDHKYSQYVPELLQVLQEETVCLVAYTKIGEALYDFMQAKCPEEPAAKVVDFIRYVKDDQFIIPAYCFETDREYWVLNEDHKELLHSVAREEMERRTKEAETALPTQSPPPNGQPSQSPRRVLYVDLDQQNRDTPQKVIANFNGEVYGFCSQDVGAEKKFGKMKITIAPEGYSSIFLLQKHAYDLARDAAPGSLEVFFISKNSTFEKGLLKLIQDGGNLARQYDSAEALSRALRIRQNGGVDVVIPPWRL